MSLGDLAAPLGAFAVSYWFAGLLARSAAFIRALDWPNVRSLHRRPTPRTGGLAVLGGVTLGMLIRYGLNRAEIQNSGELLGVLGALLVIASVSFLDDHRSVRVDVRLGVHAVAAGGAVWMAHLDVQSVVVPSFGVVQLGTAAYPITVLALMWMANLYNFMDGIDGLAGGMTVAGFGFLGWIACLNGHSAVASVSSLIAAAGGGFLPHNFPPSRIFIGDVGSVSLGFLAGVLALVGIRDGLFEVWVPLLIFSPFVVDATVTLFRRMVRLQRVWRAHRDHYYQRLVLAGWRHRRVALAEYMLMLLSGVTAVVYAGGAEPLRLTLLIAWVVIYGLAVLTVDSITKAARAEPGSHTA